MTCHSRSLHTAVPRTQFGGVDSHTFNSDVRDRLSQETPRDAAATRAGLDDAGCCGNSRAGSRDRSIFPAPGTSCSHLACSWRAEDAGELFWWHWAVPSPSLQQSPFSPGINGFTPFHPVNVMHRVFHCMGLPGVEHSALDLDHHLFSSHLGARSSHPPRMRSSFCHRIPGKPFAATPQLPSTSAPPQAPLNATQTCGSWNTLGQATQGPPQV